MNKEKEFQDALEKASFLTVMTGAGVSAESGIPTFRGAGGYWRTYSAMDLASPEAWSRDPGLVWEFYNYRRQIMSDKKTNPAHHAIAKIEERFTSQGKGFHLITQNIDDLHFEAGSKSVTRLHGSLWLVRCIQCGDVTENRKVPITPAYEGSGSPDPSAEDGKFSREDLPHCKKKNCGGVLRPHVVWFGETLNMQDIAAAVKATQSADLFVVVGTSAMVYPAAGFIGQAQGRIQVAEINLEATPATYGCDFFFEGKAGELLPGLFGVGQ